MWGDERCCGHCGSVRTSEVPNRKPMPYWCSDCRSYFSVKTGTVLERSKVPLRKWAIAIYICCTHLKSVSSMKLHRDLGVTQKTAWFMMHRLREASSFKSGALFSGTVEVDETYFGGKRRNMHAAKRKELDGRGPTGKTAVVGMKNRETKQVIAQVVERTDADTLCTFVEDRITPDTMVYTDDASAYNRLENHETVRHSVGEYLRGQAHTNGVESFWSMLKRAHKGTFHKLSPKHLQRYVNEFCCRSGLRDDDTLDQMTAWTAALVGKRLMYKTLIAKARS